MPLRTQATTITLQGVVTGNDASVPPGAQIEVRSLETGGVRSGLADAGGAYRIMGLAPGLYDVLVRAIGYRQQRHEGLQLVLGQRATLDFEFEPGAVELEPIVVTSERPFEDGTMLFFLSDRQGPPGNLDIYVTTRRLGE